MFFFLTYCSLYNRLQFHPSQMESSVLEDLNIKPKTIKAQDKKKKKIGE